MTEGLFQPDQISIPGVPVPDRKGRTDICGPRHALEYGYLNRVQVSTRRIVDSLGRPAPAAARNRQ
ncbi:hypothetical protein AruPA_02850 [Acidiphilium sp. PA]|jgi:hypothetical protein|uniref:hypothetical protein n=1 Tax=Acidiphilium sp. PA TaxID=2871705 RepID=UPI0022449DF1|nr:hypothetical protein [Acidiphilium sp. PA]MCW8305963.1 hypothetical protein [Acidiphilium sp. PA]